MHDTQLHSLQGWPDVTTTASVVVCVKQSVQITCPGTPTNGWTMVSQINPILDAMTVRPYIRAEDRFNEPTGNPFSMGMVTIKSYESGVTNFGFGVVPDGDITIGLPAAYCKGRSRLIGLGMEVTNTTAELYKQGTATVYRFPQGSMDSKVRRWETNQAGAITSCSASTQQITYQPSSLSTAMLLSGTRQWKAAEGAYVVAAFNDAQNLALPAEYRIPVIYPSTEDDIAGLVSPAYNGFTLATETPFLAIHALGGADAAYFRAHRWAPINTGGAMFTGLSAETTFNVTVNAYVEIFPTPAQPELVVLAKPSAAYDPLAMTLITRAMESMPVGVPAADNGFGDWFAGLVSELAGPIGMALNTVLPGAGVVGTGAKWLADSYLKNYATPPTPQTRPNLRQQKPKKKKANNQQKKPAQQPKPQGQKRK